MESLWSNKIAITMDEKFRNYLKWRFTQNLKTNYKILFDEWVSKVTEQQMYYFRIEMERLINRGVYREI